MSRGLFRDLTGEFAGLRRVKPNTKTSHERTRNSPKKFRNLAPHPACWPPSPHFAGPGLKDTLLDEPAVAPGGMSKPTDSPSVSSSVGEGNGSRPASGLTPHRVSFFAEPIHRPDLSDHLQSIGDFTRGLAHVDMHATNLLRHRFCCGR